MKLLLTSDWHFRFDNPICRKDDFFETQKRIINNIYKIAREEKAVVVIAGDIFHKSRPENAQELECFLIEKFYYKDTIFVAGNHDLLYHCAKNKYKSSIGVLENFNKLKKDFDGVDFYGFDFRDDMQNIEKLKNQKCRIAIIHKYCEKNKIPDYIDDGITAEYLLDNYNYDLFIVGDNHTGFIYVKDNKILVNCGCLTRQTSDMKNYKPKIYIYDTDKKKIEKIIDDFDIEDVIVDEHRIEMNARNERIENFIKKLSKEININLSFEKNIENFCKNNNIDEDVIEKINEAIYGVKNGHK